MVFPAFCTSGEVDQLHFIRVSQRTPNRLLSDLEFAKSLSHMSQCLTFLELLEQPEKSCSVDKFWILATQLRD
jgi:hypothetical protein